jgi:hypothetical protein
MHARSASSERAASVASCASAIAAARRRGERRRWRARGAARVGVDRRAKVRGGHVGAERQEGRDAYTAHDVSVHWDQAQGVTHALPALPLAPRGRPEYGRRLCGSERSLRGDAAGDRTRPSNPASAKDNGGGEQGRDEVRLDLGVYAPRGGRVSGDIGRGRNRGRTAGARQPSP